jgi:hypothetical protein
MSKPVTPAGFNSLLSHFAPAGVLAQYFVAEADGKRLFVPLMVIARAAALPGICSVAGAGEVEGEARRVYIGFSGTGFAYGDFPL